MRLPVQVVIAFALLAQLSDCLGAPPGEPGLIGLLEVRSARDALTAKDELARPIELRVKPKANSDLLGVANRLTDLKHYEWSYEQPGAAIFAYLYDGQTAWYQLELENGERRGWVMSRDELASHWLSELVTDSLSYMTTAWDKRVFSDPSDPNSGSTLPVTGPEAPVMVAGSARVDDTVWLLVVVLKESPCSSALAPRVLGSGWVPAHSKSGALNIWFYSRGC